MNARYHTSSSFSPSSSSSTERAVQGRGRRRGRFSLAHVLRAGLCLILLSGDCQAQPADEYFHGGAQHYLSNNIPAALQTVTNGLQRFPDDEKLKKLYELLNQQQQQQNQQDQKDQQQDKKEDQKQDKQKQDEKKDQQSKKDQQKKDEQKKEQEAKDKKEQEKKDQQQAGDKSKDKPDQKKDGDQQQVAAHAMTPQEAKQLLDAQKGDEEVLVFKPETDPKRQDKKLKDW